MENNYVNVVYNQETRPVTKYPNELINYLSSRFDIKKGSKILDCGSGRGDFMTAFRDTGMDVKGLDLVSYDNENVFKCDFEKDKFPFEDESFDICFSKSCLEHLNNPDLYISEIKRILKKGGKLIILVPNWLTSIFLYYFDHSHKQPYTVEALNDLLKINGFLDVHTEEFFQLPILWKYHTLKIVSKFLQIFGCPKRIAKNKFIRWSRETMCLGVCKK